MLTFVLKESSSVSVARKKRKSGSLPSPALRFLVNKQPERGLCRMEVVTKTVRRVGGEGFAKATPPSRCCGPINHRICFSNLGASRFGQQADHRASQFYLDIKIRDDKIRLL